MRLLSEARYRSDRSYTTYPILRVCCALAVLLSPVFADAAEPLDSVIRHTGLRQPRHGGVYVVAHRGAHEGIPENTLAAYRKAIELGCDFVEVDVRATKDGVLVSMHDSMVDAYTQDTKGPLRNLTIAQVKALDIGSRVGPQWREERVPTMEEIFLLCRGKIGIYLDVKEPAVLPDLLSLVRKHGMKREVLWYTGLPQQRQIQEQCTECLSMPDPGPEKNLAGLFGKLDRPPRIIASVMKFCSPTFVETAHKQGAIVITDDTAPHDWPPLLQWGVDGIQTDHPEDLIQFLDRRAGPQPANGTAP